MNESHSNKRKRALATTTTTTSTSSALDAVAAAPKTAAAPTPMSDTVIALGASIAKLTDSVTTLDKEWTEAKVQRTIWSDKVQNAPPEEDMTDAKVERTYWTGQAAEAQAALIEEKKLLLEKEKLLLKAKKLLDNEQQRQYNLAMVETQLNKEKNLEEDEQLAPVDKKLASNFFQDYKGLGHVQLITFAKACLEAFQDEPLRFFAAYIAFVQSSGYGKTRTLMETALSERLVYVCARNASSTGFPPRSSDACSFLQFDKHWSLADVPSSRALFDLTLRVLAVYKLALELKANKQEAEGQFGGDFKSFWSDADKFYKDFAGKTKDTDDIATFVDQEKLDELAFVMLAVDEASTLLDFTFPKGRTMFRALRAAMRALQEAGVQMVLVLTDTHSQVSSFLPATRFDSSLRPIKDEVLVRGHFLPFILHTSFDALRKDDNRLGRPLVAENANDYMFLQQKLLGALSFDKASSNGLLAVVLVRVAVSISAQSRVSEKLVASHMGTLLAASFDREALLVTYVSEPALAAAASLLWRTHLLSLLSTLREALVCGAVSAGPAGEITAQVVLLVAFDSLCGEKISGFQLAQPLVGFLEALLPEDSLLEAADFIPEAHTGALVSVLQFVQLPKNFEFTEKVLKELYARQTACVLPPGQAGADLLVPYMVGESYSFVLVQVKNWAVAGDFTEVLRKLNPKFVFGEEHEFAEKLCTRICMHLGDHSNAKRNVHLDTNDTKALELYSVKFRCVAKRKDLAEEVIRLLGTSNDVLTFVENVVSRCKVEKAPVAEGDLLHFPFVCGGEATADVASKAATARCCKCVSGNCTTCACKVLPCTSCNSTRCRYRTNQPPPS